MPTWVVRQDEVQFTGQVVSVYPGVALEAELWTFGVRPDPQHQGLLTTRNGAINPDGADGGNLVPPDWYYDPLCQLYIYSSPSIAVAVANEN